jgi:phosphoribosylglycinamide formyltransferase-1
MAGFMYLIPAIADVYPDRVLNIHPSPGLLHKGAHGARDTLAAGDKVGGSTVHVATREEDVGRVLDIVIVPVLPNDTPDTLQDRIKEQEWVMYPRAIRDYLKEMQ